MTNDTEVTTLDTNKTAPNSPGRVIIRFTPRILKSNMDSPGVNTLNKAGIAIKNEKSGINIQVRFRKNLRSIPEEHAMIKHNTYITAIPVICRESVTSKIKRIKVTDFILGSRDCSHPRIPAYSSESIDSLKKDRALMIERSMKLFLFLKELLIFFN
jgi:hypothetical protein